MNTKLSLAFKWAGRVVAIVLVLFWGAFFVEHLIEWFLRPDGALPPPSVWISQALHATMLVGLAMMLKWVRLGALLTVLATVAFFATIGCNRFPFIALVNLAPIGLLGVHYLVLRLL